jgi:hypothetical protein
MNILDAFIKKHGQFILIIMGKPCTNKSYIAKEFADDLKLPLINMNKYYDGDKFVEKTVNDVVYKLYDHPDNINWDMVNGEVDAKKGSGVIIYGNYLDIAKISFKPNFVFFVNMNNNLCKTILIKNKILPYSPLSISLSNEPPINPDVGEGDELAVAVAVAEGEGGDELAVVEEGDELAVVEERDDALGEGDALGEEGDEEPLVKEEGDEEEEDWEQTIDDSNTMEEIGAEGDAPGTYNEEDQEGGGDEGDGGDGGDEGDGGDGGDNKGEEEQLNNYFTNIFLPLYDELITKVKVNKFYNIKNGTNIDTIYDDMFDFLMALIEKDVSPPTKKEKKHDDKESGNGKKGHKKSKKGKKL